MDKVQAKEKSMFQNIKWRSIEKDKGGQPLTFMHTHIHIHTIKRKDEINVRQYQSSSNAHSESSTVSGQVLSNVTPERRMWTQG